jgi:hypothetical protein
MPGVEVREAPLDGLAAFRANVPGEPAAVRHRLPEEQRPLGVELEPAAGALQADGHRFPEKNIASNQATKKTAQTPVMT